MRSTTVANAASTALAQQLFAVCTTAGESDHSAMVRALEVLGGHRIGQAADA